MDELQVNAAIEDLRMMPHNQIRKAMAFKSCINNLEELQRRFSPIFDTDASVNSLLEQLRTENEAIMADLRNRDNAIDLLEEVFAADDAD